MPKPLTNNTLSRLLVLSILFFPVTFHSQSGLRLVLKYETGTVDSSSLYFDQVNSSTEHLNSVIGGHKSSGYLLAGIDSIETIDSLILAHIFLGEKIELDRSFDESSRNNIYQSGLIDKRSLDEKNMYKILDEYSNKGFPFARFENKNINQDKSKISVEYSFDPGPLVKFDSLVIRSKGKMNEQVIRKYLQLKKGSVYDESLVKNSSQILNETTFFSCPESSNVLFKEDGADLYVYVDKNPSNIFNGIIGFQPNSNTDEFTITGDVDIRLANNFNRTESIAINWKKIASQTQELDLGLILPYLFYSDIGFVGHLNIYKEDSTFINVNSKVGLNYFLGPRRSIEVFIEGKNGNELIDSDQHTDIRNRNYGVAYNDNRFNRLFNPYKGYNIDISFTAGDKNFDIELDESSEEIEISQFSYRHDLSYILNLNDKNVFLIRNQTSLLESDQLFENELDRLGGQKSIRGFDQNSIRSSHSTIQTLEYRFLLDSGTMLRAFYDQMWYQKSKVSETEYLRDLPYSFGVGFAFRTGNGMFSLDYALGSQQDNPILIRDAKIHFGFINLF